MSQKRISSGRRSAATVLLSLLLSYDSQQCCLAAFLPSDHTQFCFAHAVFVDHLLFDSVTLLCVYVC